MTNRTVLENQISTVRKYLKIVERYKSFSQEKIENDIDIRGAVERYLYLLVQSAIDLGETIIALKQYRKPESLSEVFQILHEEKLIDGKLLASMIRMTGFRNVMAHDYEDIDYSVIYGILHKDIADIQSFLKVVDKKVI